LRNSYIEASKNYLDLVADIKLDSINKNFEDINTYRKIRNSFIHSLGKISQEELETLNNFISGYSKVKLHKSYISILNPNFVFKLIEISLDLFNKLFFLYEEMSNFKRLKDALDYFFGKDRVKSSEVSSEGLLKVKYKVILDLNGSMQEVTVKISKSKISKLEFFDSSESHTELKNEIESNDYYLFRSLLPYITYNKNLLDVKVYL